MVLRAVNGRRRAGFTLLELMVVCVVIGIMTAMILPEMRGTYEAARLRSSGRGLLSVFEVARSRAITTRAAQRVRFDREGRRCVLERKARPEEGRGGFVPADIALGTGGVLDREVDYEIRRSGGVDASAGTRGPARGAAAGEEWGGESVEAITFYADGTADAGEVVLRDREGYRLGLRVHGVTGRVELKELAKE